MNENSKDITEFLLENEADSNAKNNKGETSSHFTFHLGLNAMKLLLEHGADPHVKNNEGNTPFHEFLKRVDINENSENIVKLLIQNGANPNTKNIYGNTPLDYIASEELRKIVIEAQNKKSSSCKQSLSSSQ